MAIVINGSGTVTGLAVGGLPDGTVDSGTLATDSVSAVKIAANSVDSAELIDGAVDDSHIAALAASKLTGALPAVSGASLTSIHTPAFCAIAASGQGVAHQVSTTIAFGTEFYDTDSKYNNSTFRFTPTVAGTYFLYVTVAMTNMPPDKYIGVGIRKNGTVVGSNAGSAAVSDDYGCTFCVTAVADTDDYFDVYMYHRGGSTLNTVAGGNTVFGAFRLAV